MRLTTAPALRALSGAINTSRGDVKKKGAPRRGYIEITGVAHRSAGNVPLANLWFALTFTMRMAAIAHAPTT